MLVILAVAGLVFGTYLYQPMLFDDGPYYYVSSHKTSAECQTAKAGHELHMQEAICVTGKLYVKKEE